MPAAISLGVFVALGSILPQISDLLAIALLIPAMVGLPVAAYLATVRLRGSEEWRTFFLRFSFVALGLLVELFLLVWIAHFPLRDSAKSSPTVFLIIFVALGLCTASPLWAAARGRLAGRAIVLALVVGGLLLARSTLPRARLGRTAISVPVRPEALPPIILISVDTLRRDALSYANPRAAPTPHLDALAAESILFRDAVSAAPWTIPAMASIMTGVSPYFHGAGRPVPGCQFPTLAEHLSNEGYYTRAVVGNAVLATPDGYKFETDTFSAGFADYDVYSTHNLGESPVSDLIMNALPEKFIDGGTTRQLTQLAIDWLEKNENSIQTPFFLWLHLYDPHYPYAPAAAYLPNIPAPSGMQGRLTVPESDFRTGQLSHSAEQRTWIKVLYDAEVRMVDDSIGKLLATLRRVGVYDQSLIVFTSDHGEEFWEHDGMGHGQSMHRELLDVPLLIKLPNATMSHEVTTTVPTQALLPTILDLANIQYPVAPGWPASLAPLCGIGEQEYQSESIISAATLYDEQQEAVTLSGMKLVHKIDSQQEEIYDLEHDRWEQDSVIESHPDILQAGRETLAEHRRLAREERSRRGVKDTDESGWDEETLQRLRSVGYIR